MFRAWSLAILVAWAFHPLDLPAESRPDSSSVRSSFLLREGLQIELVAEQPEVQSPVAMAFDERGRLFVAERPEQDPSAGSVRLLESPEGNGEFTASTVFADGIPWVSGIACYDGGVFVTSGTNVLYLKDSKGTRKADIRNVVLSGVVDFPFDSPAQSQLFRTIRAGPDNRFYVGTAGLAGIVKAEGAAAEQGISITDSDFSFDPRTLGLRKEPGPSTAGFTFDAFGRKFLGDQRHPFRCPVYPSYHLDRNPFFPAAPDVVEIGDPAPRISQFTTQPLTNAPRPDVLGKSGASNGIAATWPKYSCGFLVYRGTALPTNYLGNLLVCAPEEHVVYRMAVKDSPFLPTVERIPLDRDREFLVSKDAAFRPVSLATGPEGALYIADQGAGLPRGRILRVVPARFKQPNLWLLGAKPLEEVVTTLASPNAWHRDTAARLLHTRQDKSVLPLVSNLLYQSRLPAARYQALQTLAGLDVLIETPVIKGLTDPHEQVRSAALALCRQGRFATSPSESLTRQLRLLGNDPSPQVRMQLAFTLGYIQREGRDVLLEELLRKDLGNPWIETAVLASLGNDPSPAFLRLVSDARFRNNSEGQRILAVMAKMIGLRGQLNEVSRVLNYLYTANMPPDQSFALGYLLGDGLHRTRSALELVDPQIRNRIAYPTAILTASEETAPWASRVRCLDLIGVSPYMFPEVGDWILLLLNPKEGAAVQAAAIRSLSRMLDPGVTTGILGRWSSLRPEAKAEAVNCLLTRNERLLPLLAAMERRIVPLGDLSAASLNFLRTHHDPTVRDQAIRLFGPVPVQRPDVVRNFTPALKLNGSVARGREIFEARCLRCHRGGDSSSLDSGLAEAKRLGKETILMEILEPHRVVSRGSKVLAIETKGGENYVGILLRETPLTLHLRAENGEEIIVPVVNVGAVRPQPWSLMPEGLETGFTTANLADLLEFVMQLAWTPATSAR